jgi:hypothetical protein
VKKLSVKEEILWVLKLQYKSIPEASSSRNRNRRNTISLGGESTFPFYAFDGDTGSKATVGLKYWMSIPKSGWKN